ncbi:MAG TPA: aldo/keto reductase [Acidobacteriaceae bacterium]|jgi:L-galactose dehydrogenase|nr:aldo/keto reductase [Acidobacteriaceae bacterium]
MEYRKLGQTDLSLSLIGFGSATLGDVFGNVDPSDAIRAVHLAVDSGINFFDSSPYYGITLAETRLGQALAGRRKRVVLATKCGRYGFDEFDFSARRVTASIDESLRRLQTDYIDLFQVHDVEFGDVEQIIHETLPALRKLQQQGKARYIGITGYPPKLLRRIAEAVPVDSILTYCRYNLINTDMDGILTPFAREHGIGLINASGLCMGLLTEHGPPDWHPAPQQVRDAGRKAAEFCRAHGADISKLALRFCLNHPFVSSTLIGISSTRQVETSLELLNSSTDQELLAQVKAILAPVFNYVWPSGRPENQE